MNGIIDLDGHSISSRKLLILSIAIVLFFILIGLVLIHMRFPALYKSSDKNIVNIEYTDLIVGESKDILIIYLKTIRDASPTEHTLNPSTNIDCKTKKGNNLTNSNRYEEVLVIICVGDFVDEADEKWNGTITIFLRNGRVETHTLSVEARSIYCPGCPNLSERSHVPEK